MSLKCTKHKRMGGEVNGEMVALTSAASGTWREMGSCSEQEGTRVCRSLKTVPEHRERR